LATAAVSVQASFVLHEITPARGRVESLHFVQTCPEMRNLVDEMGGIAPGERGVATAVLGEATWPLSWYLRNTSTWFGTLPPDGRPRVVVCDPEQQAETRAKLGAGYEAELVPLRAWWLMERYRPTLREVARYATTRVPWGFIGSTEVIVLRRVDEGAAADPPSEGVSSLPRDDLSGRLLMEEDDDG
jgi:hypothetical protein